MEDEKGKNNYSGGKKEKEEGNKIASDTCMTKRTCYDKKKCIYTGCAITYGNFWKIGSRLQTMTGTVILRSFLKCPAFFSTKEVQNNNPFCSEKGVQITLFQSNPKNSWLAFFLRPMKWL